MTAPGMLSAALALAAKGFPVFPVHEPANGACSCRKGAACDRPAKHPRTGRGVIDATTEEHAIRRWWARWPTANIGVACGGPMRLVVIDLDPPDGPQNIEALTAKHGALPETLTARTGRGAHLYLRCPADLDVAAVRPCAGKIAPHVDQRGPDGYVIAPPSTHASGSVYTWDDPAAPIANLPPWLYELATREKARPAPAPQPQSRKATRRDAPGRPDAFTRAVAWLRTCEPSIQGQNGSGKLAYASCAMARGFDLSDGDAFAALAGDWNRRCEPRWSAKELEHAVTYQRAHGRRFAVGELLRADRPLPPRAPRPASRDSAPTTDDDAAEAAAIQWEGNMRTNAGEPDTSFPPADDAPPSTRPKPHAAPPPTGQDGAPSDHPDVDRRAVVRFDSSRVDLAITESIAHLRGDPNLFQRTGALVTVVSTSSEDVKRYPFLAKDGPRVVSLSAASLLASLCSVARFEIQRGERVIVKPPPASVVSGIHTKGAWSGIRPLRGILETPTIRPLAHGGDVVSTPGYDQHLGYYYRPPHGVVFPPVAIQPTPEDGRAALDKLTEVFADFPFETRAGRFAAVAAVLTMIARPAIEGNTPIFLLDATTQGTGKTLAVDVVHKITTGRVAGRGSMPVSGRNIDEAELRKVLSTIAQSAATSATFDNIESPAFLGGSALAQIATTGIHEGRRMGTDTPFSVPWTAVLFATGNNVEVSPDVYRRTLLVRLASQHEKPHLRPKESYTHKERAGQDRLLAWVGEQRPRLVHAALTLLRAFIVAGAPQRARRVGSFETWCDLVASAIVWAGGADPGLCFMGTDDATERPDEAALRVVLRDLPRLSNDPRGITAKALVGLLWTPDRIRGQEVPPDGFEDLREALESLAPPPRSDGPPAARELGKRFGALRGKPLGGRKLQRASTNAGGGLARWQVVAADHFEAAPPAAVA